MIPESDMYTWGVAWDLPWESIYWQGELWTTPYWSMMVKFSMLYSGNFFSQSPCLFASISTTFFISSMFCKFSLINLSPGTNEGVLERDCRGTLGGRLTVTKPWTGRREVWNSVSANVSHVCFWCMWLPDLASSSASQCHPWLPCLSFSIWNRWSKLCWEVNRALS